MEQIDRERMIREKVAAAVEHILESGGEELLLDVIRGRRRDPSPATAGNGFRMQVAELLVNAVDWEAESDRVLEWALHQLDLPWWVPGGVVRKLVDDQLPEAILNPVLRGLAGGGAPAGNGHEINIYQFLLIRGEAG